MMMAQAFLPDMTSILDEDDEPRLASHEIGMILTPAEHLVATQLAAGGSNKEIAFAINCSEANVKLHIKTISKVLGTTNRVQSALMLVGYLPPNRKAVMSRIESAEEKARKGFFAFAIIPRNIRRRYDSGESIDLTAYLGPEWSESRVHYARWKALEAMRLKFSPEKAAA